MPAYHIEEQRSFLVVQSNELIRKAHYGLTLTEQKVILYLISKIKPDDSEFQWYDFTVGELCRVFGFTDSGQNYKRLMDAIKAVHDKSFWFNINQDEIRLMKWIDSPIINKNTGAVRVRFDDGLKPYLIGLKEKFTAFQLENVLVMRSAHCILLYELFLSYARADIPQVYEITLEQLKRYLYVSENYDTYNNFKRRVIDPALKQINGFTDLQVSMEPVRKGRSIHSLRFTLTIDNDAVNHWKRSSLRHGELEGTKRAD